MRYAFNDLLRVADVDPMTRRALVGHVTEEMQEHYSTVRLDEKRAAMAQVSAKLKSLTSAGQRREGDDRGDAENTDEAA